MCARYACVRACWWTRAVCVHGVGAQCLRVRRGSVCVCGNGSWGGGQVVAGGRSPQALCSDGICAPTLPAFSAWMQHGALWSSTQARSHLTGSLGGVRSTPPPRGEVGPEHTPSLTNQQDGRTCFPHGPCRTLLPG